MKKDVNAEEAILLASSNSAIADYLVKRGRKTLGEASQDLISEKVEAALLERGDRLVDLRLAEFGFHLSTVKELFQRSSNDLPLRSLVLSNQKISERYRFLLQGFPSCLFDDEDALKAYLATASLYELESLFSNPTLHHSFLENVLSLRDYWQAIPQQSHAPILYILASNPIMQTPVRWIRYPDQGAWGKESGFINAAWRLVIELDASAGNAEALSYLYENLTPFCDRRDGILDALSKWIPDNKKEEEREELTNEGFMFSSYQEVRRSVSAMLLKNGPSSKWVMLKSDDIAIRCGAYVIGKHTPREMRRAIEKDGWWATASFMKNPSCWQTAGHREAFIGFPGSDNEVYFWLDKVKKEHPEWFEFSELGLGDEDRPISESSMNEFIRHACSAAGVTALHASIESLKRAQRLQFALLSVALAIFLLCR